MPSGFRFGSVGWWWSRSLGIFGEGTVPLRIALCVWMKKVKIFTSIIHFDFRVCCERIYICGSMCIGVEHWRSIGGSGDDSERAK